MPVFNSNAMSKAMPNAFNSYKPKWLRVYGAICVNEKGEVLLVKDRRSKLWSFPKGKCNRDEEDIQCARRELKEETGLVITEDPVSTHKLRGGVYFVFPVTSADGDFRQDPSETRGLETVPRSVTSTTRFTPRFGWEIEEVSWWPLDTLPQSSNVDVSIFRTLMRASKERPALEFIESAEAHRRVNTIRRSIVDAEDPRGFQGTPNIRGVPLALPSDIPLCTLSIA